MVFSSFTFLFCFLPLTMICYYLVKSVRAKNLVLFLASIVFYAWGEPVYVLLMLASILMNYLFGLLLGKLEKDGQRRLVLIAALVFNLGAIGLFKYGNFILENLGLLLGRDLFRFSFALPLGISFYTFQILSYVLDVYRRETPTQKSLLNLATYIVLFPQLVAGPIVRYDQVQAELQQRQESWTDLVSGIERFAIGFGKKILLANSMAVIADSVFNAAAIPEGTAWLAAVAYTLQIYFDFSGYSDMAIGLGRMFGFHFSENFNYPYISASVTEFWRRWHISLSTWFRDYVYFPLGGSRCSRGRSILNLLIVWMLTGLWHGASWNFVIWGVYYGVLLIVEKYVLGNVLNKIPKMLRHVLTLLIVIFGWMLFRLESWDAIRECLQVMFRRPFSGMGAFLAGNTDVLEKMAWMLPACIGCLPLGEKIRAVAEGKAWYPWLKGGYAIAVYFLSIAVLFGSTYNPFIYFRF